MESLIDRLKRELWEGFDQEQEFPARQPMLAHYTSIDTLESIAKTNQLWLSNPLFMNDWEELRFGLNTGAEELRNSEEVAEACGTLEVHGQLIRWFDHHYASYNRIWCSGV